MQHRRVHTLAHRRPNSCSFGKPHARAESITVFRSDTTSLAKSLAHTHPYALPSPDARADARAQPISLSGADTKPHVGPQQQPPHARTIERSIGNAEQRCANGGPDGCPEQSAVCAADS